MKIEGEVTGISMADGKKVDISYPRYTTLSIWPSVLMIWHAEFLGSYYNQIDIMYLRRGIHIVWIRPVRKKK